MTFRHPLAQIQCLVVAMASLLTACAPVGEQAECSATVPCERGEMCDENQGLCVAQEIDLSNTESPAPATFADKAIPFFRGQVCLPHDVQTGKAIPISVIPCLHPCVQVRQYVHHNWYSCIGSRCDGWITTYVVGTSAAQDCPADAFASVDRDQCSWGPTIELALNVQGNGEPITGSLSLEIPFLSNSDMEDIIASDHDPTATNTKIAQYPRESNRIPGGKDIRLHPSYAAPPETCDGETNCPCYDIGF